MSNPAVTKLVRDDIGNLRFWMDDNIGESIHIHLADFRLDLTVEEIEQLADELSDSMNQLIDIDGFDCQKIDPVFLSLLLAKRLKYLKAVKMDTVRLSELIVNYRGKFGFLKYNKLTESRVVKALRGDSSENDGARKSHHVGQSSQQRLDTMKQSIEEHGYPYDGQYIILYEDQMLIRDGQHRASCLYVENGDMEIPVLRLYFSNPKVSSYEKSYLKQLVAAFGKIDRKRMIKEMKKLLKKVYFGLQAWKGKVHLATHKKELRRMEQIYFQ